MSDQNSLLSKIEEGMQVYDSKGNEIGTVEFVHFSEAHGSRYSGAASLPEESAETDLVDIISKLFGADNLPRELRDRLLMHGFIKVDSARLFGTDRYVMSDQIAKVANNGVYLGVENSAGLLKA